MNNGTQIDNVDTIPQDTSNNSLNESVDKLSVGDLSDDFKVAELLGNLEKSDDNSTEKIDNETLKDDAVEDEDGDEDVKKLLDEDKLLEKLNLYKSMGLTEDEASKKVYEDEFNIKTNIDNAQNQIFNTDMEEIKNYFLPDEQFQALDAAYQNPTEANLLYHLKNNPQMREIYGASVDEINNLNIFQDHMSNAIFRQQVADSYRHTVKPILEAAENARNAYTMMEQKREGLVQRLNDDFNKSFPELDNEEPITMKIAAHFVHRLSEKLQNLSEKDKQDEDLVNKIYQSTKNDFQKIYPVLKKKMGITEPPAVVDDKLAQQKINQMQQLSSNPTNGGQETMKISLSGDNPMDVAKLLNNLDKLKG